MTFSISLINTNAVILFFEKVMLILKLILIKSLCPMEPTLTLLKVSEHLRAFMKIIVDLLQVLLGPLYLQIL